ncbi:c5b7ac93-e53c-4567-a023-b565cef9c879 [Thermothielavioides terrestris]|uniref:C5b7ac93-e53c-4567-a023-b565cef9c879 n=1 Tax=Thermothielavioides terrestris TaxID=2587410 RepID=A0A3S4F1Z4_9PEZI|nr:c5b7ac93-e53c-4567-a023-b565cef9c879 [Thermothielavioides terrestris]
MLSGALLLALLPVMALASPVPPTFYGFGCSAGDTYCNDPFNDGKQYISICDGNGNLHIVTDLATAKRTFAIRSGGHAPSPYDASINAQPASGSLWTRCSTLPTTLQRRSSRSAPAKRLHVWLKYVFMSDTFRRRPAIVSYGQESVARRRAAQRETTMPYDTAPLDQALKIFILDADQRPEVARAHYKKGNIFKKLEQEEEEREGRAAAIETFNSGPLPLSENRVGTIGDLDDGDFGHWVMF